MCLIELSSTDRIFGAVPLAVGTLATRADDTAVQHPRNADVVDVRELAGDLVRDVDSRHPSTDELVLADWLRARRTGGEAACRNTEIARCGTRQQPVHVVARRHRHVEQLVAEQCPVRDAPAAAAHNPVLDCQIRPRDAEVGGCEVEQRALRRRRRCTYLPATRLGAGAGARTALVRRNVRILRGRTASAPSSCRALRPRSSAGRSACPDRARRSRSSAWPCCQRGS